MKLLFVYNADAGIGNAIMDSIHKTLSPQTYECALCQLTYGVASMDKSWRNYLKSLPVEASFFHRNDFKATYPDVIFELPAVLIERDESLSPLLTAQQMSKLTDVNELMQAMSAALRKVGISV